MICETCHGMGTMLRLNGAVLPCLTCGGHRFDYCCQGEIGEVIREAPDTDSKPAGAPQRHVDQAHTSPPSYMTEAELLQGLQDMGLGVWPE
jgi:hypothetical protein